MKVPIRVKTIPCEKLSSFHGYVWMTFKWLTCKRKTFWLVSISDILLKGEYSWTHPEYNTKVVQNYKWEKNGEIGGFNHSVQNIPYLGLMWIKYFLWIQWKKLKVCSCKPHGKSTPQSESKAQCQRRFTRIMCNNTDDQFPWIKMVCLVLLLQKHSFPCSSKTMLVQSHRSIFTKYRSIFTRWGP